MPSKKKFKCLNCNKLSYADARNRKRQCFCSKPECRRASKAASQRLWIEKPENQNYFTGTDNCERVRQWRKAHPDYRSKKRSATEVALQDVLITQSVNNVPVISPSAASTLQDIYMSQPALVIGFMSVLTGCVLQDDLMDCARSFMRRGLDILRRPGPGSKPLDCSCPKQTQAAPTSDSKPISDLLDNIIQIRLELDKSSSQKTVS